MSNTSIAKIELQPPNAANKGPHSQPSSLGIAPLPSSTPPPRDILGIKWAFAVIAILSNVFLFALDQTIVADVQPNIVARFGSIEKLPWLSVAFILSTASTNLFWGRIYGQFNPKWVYVLCLVIFEVGSAVCGAAPNMNALIIGRALASLRGGGMYLGVMMMLSLFTTPLERPKYIGIIGVLFGVGIVLGPITGGAFADNLATTWRWAFYINLCIGGAFAPGFFFLLPSRDLRPGVKTGEKLKVVDWNSAQDIALFCVSGALFIALNIHQVWSDPQSRVFPVHFLKHKALLIQLLVRASAGTSSFITIYFFPLYFQFVKQNSSLLASVRFLPFIRSLATFSMLSGNLMVRSGYNMLYTIDKSTSNGFIYRVKVLNGIGTGMFLNAPLTIAQWIAPPKEQSSAVRLIMCARGGGLAIALSIANTIFLNLTQSRIHHILHTLDNTQVRGLTSGVGSDLLQTLTTTQQQQVLEAIIFAISRIFIMSIASGCFYLCLSLLIDCSKIKLS